MPGVDEHDEDLDHASGADEGIDSGSDAGADEGQGDEHSADDGAAGQGGDQGKASQDGGDQGQSNSDAAGDGAEKEDTMFSRVAKALGIGKDKPKDDKKPAGAEGKDGQQKPGAAKPGDKQAGAQDEQIPPELAKHPAYQKLQREHETFSQSHEKQLAISTFMEKNTISPAQMTNAMNLTALSNSDPEEFYNQIKKIEEEFAIMLNIRLPADLQKKVEDGVLTKEDAAELNKARIGKLVSDRKAESATARATAGDARQEAAARGDLVGRWFDGIAQKDPNVEFMTDAIEGEIYRLANLRKREGKPAIRTSQEHLALLNEAYSNVKKRFRSTNPKTPVNSHPRSNPRPAQTQSNVDQTPREAMADDVLNIINNRATG